MRKFVRALLFLAAFQLDLTVRASGGDAEPVSDPPKCWIQKEGPCSVQAGKKPLALRTDDLRLWGERESLFSRESKSWRFLKGVVRATSKASARLAFPYGEVAFEDGEFWILEQGDRFVVRAIHSSLNVKTRDGRDLELPEGLELWVGPVDGSGRQAYGVPSLIQVEDHLRRLSRLEPDKEKFVAEAKDLRERWKNRQDVASALYGEVADRHIASEKAAAAAESARRKAAEAERAGYRKMLYQRAFER